ncbi:MAG: HIT family protein [Bdellovibrionota bacterium]|nr:HIT family protein [Bdellovibrionota bacterium]
MRHENCVFCKKNNDYVEKFSSVFAVYDSYPVSPGHCLIIPFEHRLDFFDLNENEKADSLVLLERLKNRLSKEDPSITGFNIGMNCGEDAGQTVFHCHIHLIPRRKADCKNPKGGVRGVIPNKQSY